MKWLRPFAGTEAGAQPATADRDTRQELRSRRLLWIAILLSNVSVVILFAWSVIDASFPITCIRLEILVTSNEFWVSLGNLRGASLGLTLRMAGLTGLCCLWAGSVLLLIIEADRFRQKVAWIGLVSALLLPGFWVAVRGQIDEARVLSQVRRVLPQFIAVKDAFSREWPTKSGEVRGIIRYYASNLSEYKGVVMVKMPVTYPRYETFGPLIFRDEDGVIRFDLAPSYSRSLEYHPRGTTPRQYISEFGNMSPPVSSVQRVGDKWFLVNYSATD